MMTDVSFVSKFDGTEQKYVLFLPESLSRVLCMMS